MGWNGLCTKKLAVHLTHFDTIQQVIRCCFVCFILCRLEMTSRNLSSSKKPRGRRGLEGSIGCYVSKLYITQTGLFILKMKQFYGYKLLKKKTVYRIRYTSTSAHSRFNNGRASADSEVGKATTILWTQMHLAWLLWSRIAQKAEDSISQGASEARQRHTFYAVASPWRSWFNTIPKPCTIRLAQKSDWHFWPWTGFLDVFI